MRIFCLTCVVLLSVAHQAIAQPVVAASIKPLQLIAVAITEGVSTPLLVLDGNQDPHHPALRPSQRRAMDQADLFFWVGPVLETGMERVVAGLDAVTVTALDLPGLVLHRIDNFPDPHVWLDTRNAVIMAAALRDQLMLLDSQHAAVYSGNYTDFALAMENTAEEISGLLSPENFPPFVVYHNGYQYFEKQFGLGHLGSFTNNEEVQPGIRQILAIKTKLEERNINCAVVNPSVNTRNLDNQLERPEMQFVVIDVLANDSAITKTAYGQFMKSVALAFNACRQ